MAVGALPEGGSGRDMMLTAALSGGGVSSGFVTEVGQGAEHFMFGVRRESPKGSTYRGRVLSLAQDALGTHGDQVLSRSSLSCLHSSQIRCLFKCLRIL